MTPTVELFRKAPAAQTNPSDEALREEFDRIGAVVIPSVLTSEEVSLLRASIERAFSPFDQRSDSPSFVRALSAAMILRLPDVLGAIMHPRIIATLKALLEPAFALIPDFNLQRNMFDFTDTRKSLTHLFGLIGYGWHHDAGSERASHYLFAPDYRCVKCGIYLQDNTIEWGGGIEIAPGAHRRPFRTGFDTVDFLAHRVRHNIKILSTGCRVELKAGDFVVFDSWLPHRGNQPLALAGQISDKEKAEGCVRMPPEHSKLVIYFNASRRSSARDYLAHCLTRGRTELIRARAGNYYELFFADFPGLAFPKDYPTEFVDLVSRNGLFVGQLDGEDLAEAITLRREALESGLFNNYASEPESRQSDG